jgi:hypothetical protein
MSRWKLSCHGFMNSVKWLVVQNFRLSEPLHLPPEVSSQHCNVLGWVDPPKITQARGSVSFCNKSLTTDAC